MPFLPTVGVLSLAITLPTGLLILLLVVKYRRILMLRRSRVHVAAPTENVSATMSGNLVVEKTDVPIHDVYHFENR